jgi:signal transduction histidine kinase
VTGPAPLALQDCRVAYAATNRDKKVVEVGGAVELFCSSDGRYLGSFLPDLVPQLSGSARLLDGVLGGRLPGVEWTLPGPEGAEAWKVLTLTLLPRRDASGDVAGVFCLIRDATVTGSDAVRSPPGEGGGGDLESATVGRELRRLGGVRSAFVPLLSHELRTPLASIAAYVEMLLDGEMGELADEQRRCLEGVRRNAARLEHVTEHLLLAARIATGRVELVLRPADPLTLVRRVAATVRPRLEARGQRLALIASPEQPSILCDETRTAQVVSTLLRNASQEAPSGELLWVTLAPAGDGFLGISVAHTGAGLSAEEDDELPEGSAPGAAAQASIGGSALGLYVAQALVELHGGRMWSESGPGGASAFHVTLPRVDGTSSGSGERADTVPSAAGEGPGR